MILQIEVEEGIGELVGGAKVDGGSLVAFQRHALDAGVDETVDVDREQLPVQPAAVQTQLDDPRRFLPELFDGGREGDAVVHLEVPLTRQLIRSRPPGATVFQQQPTQH